VNTAVVAPALTEGWGFVFFLDLFETDAAFVSFGVVFVLGEGLGREEGAVHVSSR
jgi:hypothetical protein